MLLVIYFERHVDKPYCVFCGVRFVIFLFLNNMSDIGLFVCIMIGERIADVVWSTAGLQFGKRYRYWIE